MRPEIVAYHEAGHAVAFAAFLQGLQELGWTVGRNVQIDFRGFTDDASRIRRCGSMWPRLHAIVAPFVIDGPLDGKIFRTYVERCLAPTLDRGDIVFMDNLASRWRDGGDRGCGRDNN